MPNHKLALGLAISCALITDFPAIARVNDRPDFTAISDRTPVILITKAGIRAPLDPASVAAKAEIVAAKISEIEVQRSDRSPLAQFGAAIIFVAPGGSDQTGNGSQSQPLRTITAALQTNLPPGSVIQLAPGTYSTETGEKFPLKLPRGVTIRGNSTNKGEEITISGGGTFISPTFASQNIAIVAAHNTQIEGVTVINSNSRGYGIWLESSRNVGISNNTFKDTSHDGVFLTGSAHTSIANNIFTKNKGSGISAVGISTGEIRNNLFDDTGFGLSIGQKSQVFVIENRIVNNVDGVIISNLAVPTLRDNLIANSSRNGLVVLKDRNGQPTPDLGTANNPGNNTFRNNQQKDINNVSGVAIVAAGNEYSQSKVAGELDLVATNIPEAIAQLSQPAAIQAPSAAAAPIPPTIPPLPASTPVTPVTPGTSALPNVAIAPSPGNPAPNPGNSGNAVTDPDATEILIPLPISPSTTAAVKLGNPATNPPADRLEPADSANDNDQTTEPVSSSPANPAPAAIAPELETAIAISEPTATITDAPEAEEQRDSPTAAVNNPANPTPAIEQADPTVTALPPFTSITIGRDPGEPGEPSDVENQPKPSKSLPAQSNAPATSTTNSPAAANPIPAPNTPKVVEPVQTVSPVKPAPINENVELVKTPLPADVQAQQEGLPPILPGVPTAQTAGKPITANQPSSTQVSPAPTTNNPATPQPTRSPATQPAAIYRVLVVAVSADAIPKLQQIVPTAFSTQYQGQPAMQVGAYGDRALADRQVSQLSEAGYQVEVITIRP
jgi:parallel beta-helix repeat protein